MRPRSVRQALPPPHGDRTLPALAAGHGSVTDLTHELHEEFPTFFGQQQFFREQKFKYAEHKFTCSNFGERAPGTHVDAPLHFSADGLSVAASLPSTSCSCRSASSTSARRRPPIRMRSDAGRHQGVDCGQWRHSRKCLRRHAVRDGRIISVPGQVPQCRHGVRCISRLSRGRAKFLIEENEAPASPSIPSRSIRIRPISPPITPGCRRPLGPRGGANLDKVRPRARRWSSAHQSTVAAPAARPASSPSFETHGVSMSTVAPPSGPESDPRVKAVFDDIRATRKSDFINNMWALARLRPRTAGADLGGGQGGNGDAFGARIRW